MAGSAAPVKPRDGIAVASIIAQRLGDERRIAVGLLYQTRFQICGPPPTCGVLGAVAAVVDPNPPGTAQRTPPPHQLVPQELPDVLPLPCKQIEGLPGHAGSLGSIQQLHQGRE